MRRRGAPLLRWTGFVAGCAIGVVFVLAGRVPEGRAATGVALALAAAPTPALAVKPAGKDFLEARDLRPGAAPAKGRLTVAPYASNPVVVRMRTKGPVKDLDGLVQVAVSADNKRVFEGKLGQLRSWGALRFGLRPGRERTLTFRAWLPRSVRSGYQGRSAKLGLELKASGARR